MHRREKNSKNLLGNWVSPKKGRAGKFYPSKKAVLLGVFARFKNPRVIGREIEFVRVSPPWVGLSPTAAGWVIPFLARCGRRHPLMGATPLQYRKFRLNVIHRCSQCHILTFATHNIVYPHGNRVVALIKSELSQKTGGVAV